MGEDPDPDHKPPEEPVCVACPHRGCHPQGRVTGLGASSLQVNVLSLDHELYSAFYQIVRQVPSPLHTEEIKRSNNLE